MRFENLSYDELLEVAEWGLTGVYESSGCWDEANSLDEAKECAVEDFHQSIKSLWPHGFGDTPSNPLIYRLIAMKPGEKLNETNLGISWYSNPKQHEERAFWDMLTHISPREVKLRGDILYRLTAKISSDDIDTAVSLWERSTQFWENEIALKHSAKPKLVKLETYDQVMSLTENTTEYSMTQQDFYAKNNIDPDSISWAGKGDFGEAYYVNGDRVLKKTTAVSEFDIAKRLIGDTSPVFKVFADIYAAELVEGEKWILMEELEIDSEIEDYYYQVSSYMEEQGLPIQYTHSMDWDETDAPDDVKEFADQLDDINRAFRALGIEASDMRPENMGYDKNGKLKAFDLHDRSIGEIRNFIREALLERFGFNNNKSFSPPENVKSTVRRAISSGGQTANGGNEGSGVRKAQDLADGGIQTHAQMKRLKAFFDNNQAGSPEWDLHGGNAAKMWVDRALAGTHDSNMRTKEHMRRVGGGGYGMNDGMGSMSATMMKTNNSRNHSVWTKAKNATQNKKIMNKKKNIQETLRLQLLSKIITEEQFEERMENLLSEDAQVEEKVDFVRFPDKQLRRQLLSNIISEEQYDKKISEKDNLNS